VTAANVLPVEALATQSADFYTDKFPYDRTNQNLLKEWKNKCSDAF